MSRPTTTATHPTTPRQPPARLDTPLPPNLCPLSERKPQGTPDGRPQRKPALVLGYKDAINFAFGYDSKGAVPRRGTCSGDACEQAIFPPGCEQGKPSCAYDFRCPQ